MTHQETMPTETKPTPEAGAADGAGSPKPANREGAPQVFSYVPTNDDPGDTPAAGDIDPGATASADETGQTGDITEPKKRNALPWS